MSKQHLYFPTRLEDALSFLRSQRGLDQICGTDNHTVIGYTDPALAVLQSVQSGTGDDSHEVCLVVAEVDQELIGHIINGDMTHFGPCGRWRSDHILELELTAQMLLSHGGRFSLQIVKS